MTCKEFLIEGDEADELAEKAGLRFRETPSGLWVEYRHVHPEHGESWHFQGNISVLNADEKTGAPREVFFSHGSSKLSPDELEAILAKMRELGSG